MQGPKQQNKLINVSILLPKR